MRERSLAVHARVIGKRRDALPAERLRQVFGLPARAAINDAAFVLVRADEVRELALRVALRAHGKLQVRPVEAVDEDRGRAREQAAHDVAARGLVGGRGQRHDLDAIELGREVSQI